MNLSSSSFGVGVLILTLNGLIYQNERIGMGQFGLP